MNVRVWMYIIHLLKPKTLRTHVDFITSSGWSDGHQTFTSTPKIKWLSTREASFNVHVAIPPSFTVLYFNILQMVSWKWYFSFQEPLFWRHFNSRTREKVRLFLLLTSSNSIWVTHNPAILKYRQYSVLS